MLTNHRQIGIETKRGKEGRNKTFPVKSCMLELEPKLPSVSDGPAYLRTDRVNYRNSIAVIVYPHPHKKYTSQIIYLIVLIFGYGMRIT